MKGVVIINLPFCTDPYLLPMLTRAPEKYGENKKGRYHFARPRDDRRPTYAPCSPYDIPYLITVDAEYLPACQACQAVGVLQIGRLRITDVGSTKVMPGRLLAFLAFTPSLPFALLLLLFVISFTPFQPESPDTSLLSVFTVRTHSFT